MNPGILWGSRKLNVLLEDEGQLAKFPALLQNYSLIMPIRLDRQDNQAPLLEFKRNGPAMTTTGPNIGQTAPEIDLPDGAGERWTLSGARGRVVALFFYPGDETPVCTKQLCSVRDNWARYQQTGAEVVGVNTDSIEKHRSFAANHNLPMRLLSDSEGKTVRDYDMKNLIGTRRGVIVIDKDGVIRFRKVVMPIFRPTDDEVLDAINEAAK